VTGGRGRRGVRSGDVALGDDHEPARPRRSGHSTRWLVVAAAVLLVMGGALVVARGSGSEGSGTGGLSAGGGVVDGGIDDVDGVPVLSGAYRTEGDLADGLMVPPGTVLLGDVLPTRPFILGSPVDDPPGWEAFLLVVGDMAAVLDDLDAQVARLGMEPIPDGFYAAGCQPTDYQPPEGLVECRRGWLGAELAASAVLLRGVVQEGFGSDTSRPVSLLTLEVGRLDGAGVTTTSAAPGVPGPPATVASSTTIAAPGTLATAPPATISPSTTIVPSTPVAPARRLGPLGGSSGATSLRAAQVPPTVPPSEPLPSDWPEPPGPGERLGDGITPPDARDVLSLRLPEGANAVVAPWPTGGNAANYEAIVAVTGDPDQVLADLVEQIEGFFDSDVQDSTQEIDGDPIRTVRGDQAGGSKLDLVAATVGDRTWITVSTGYD
jgi:hypothetical protein